MKLDLQIPLANLWEICQEGGDREGGGCWYSQLLQGGLEVSSEQQLSEFFVEWSQVGDKGTGCHTISCKR